MADQNESRKRACPTKEGRVYPSSISIKRSCPSNKTTDMSVRIAEQLLMDKKNTESNIVFCPVSINVLLSLLAAGSGGETLDQFLDFFGAESIDDVNSLASELISVVSPGEGARGGGVGLSFASGVWLDRSLSLRHSFKHAMDSVYKDTALECVDFKSKAEDVTKEVNLWVKKKTNSMITEAIPRGKINSLTRLILANALYFKGAWLRPFYAWRTKDRDFHLLNGSKIQVPFMTDDKMQRLLGIHDGFKVLKLPYQKGNDKRQFSMCFYLPDANDGLPLLIEKLASEPDFLDSHVPDSSKLVNEFFIPKFKIAFDFEASQVLTSLGLVLPFSGEEADLSNMVDSTNGEILNATDIFHTSIVEVNEEGTVAVGTTRRNVGGCSRSSKPLEYYDFVADHPFLFIIREDKTGVVLFIGSVVDPSAAN